MSHKPQMTKQHMTKRHITHREMTIAQPQADKRQLIVPESSIVEDPPLKIGCFGYLLSWVTSLLALVLLPLGLMLILVGGEINTNLAQDWVPVTATVQFAGDDGIGYSWQYNNKSYTARLLLGWEYYIQPAADGSLSARISVCDLAGLAQFRIPRETGNDFDLWINPEDPETAQCIEISHNSGAAMALVGWLMLVFAVVALFKKFNKAARG